MFNQNKYPNKKFPFQPKKKGKILYRVDAEKSQGNETKKLDIIPNTIDYLLSRTFMEDGFFDPSFCLLEDFHQKNIPSYMTRGYPSLGICDDFLGEFRYKDKKDPNCLVWAPNGKKISVGNSKGDITIIDGSQFTSEQNMKIQLKERSIKTMALTKNSKNMLLGDEEGLIKYLDTNYKQVKEFKCSETKQDGIKEISISPTDQLFVTASKEKNLKVWDFEEGKIIKELPGHANDINCVKWHPHMGLIVSGSKDTTIKFWDPNSNTNTMISSMMTHTNAINSLAWNMNGNWLLSCSRDHSIRMYDIRTLKEIQSFTGFSDDVEDLAWNPYHERLFAAATKDGSISFWMAFEDESLSTIPLAHSYEKKENDMMLKMPSQKKEPPKGVKITGLAWNPTGDQLASCGSDNAIKFWGRSRYQFETNEISASQFDMIAETGDKIEPTQ